MAAPRPSLSRRTLILGGGAALLAAGGGLGGWAHSRKKGRARDALAHAQMSRDALGQGALDDALARGLRARELDPTAREPALAYLHASAALAIDGPSSPERGVSLVTDARLLGANGEELAIASIASLVAIANVPITERQLDALADRPYGATAMFHLVRGAALDLVGSHESHRNYARAIEIDPSLFLARVRLVRAHVIEGRLVDAARAWELLPDGPAKATLSRVLAARGRHLYEGGEMPREPEAIARLPRSLRGLATVASFLDDASRARRLVRDDFDAPLVAALAGELALERGRDPLAAEIAGVATQLKRALPEVASVGARAALREGNLARAIELAGEGPDDKIALMLRTIQAYEAGDSRRLEELAVECKEKDAWALAGAAAGLLGKTPPDHAVLDAAFGRREPWADMLLFDLAVRDRRFDEARRVITHWDQQRTEARSRRARRLEAG